MLPNSTLKLNVIKQALNYQTPWSVGSSSASSATVSVITFEGKIYLVTNAHAVMETTFLKIKFNQGATELEVKVDWLDPILDIAILKLDISNADILRKAEERIKRLDALELLADYQKQQTEVFAYGYPAGGTTLAFTKGTVSRVEVTSMSMSSELATMVQTSTPINPGNSGGPITIKDPGEQQKEICVGIVAQGRTDLQNTGYFIPASSVIGVIKRYEKYREIKDRGYIRYVTAPKLNIQYQELKNKALRSGLGLPKVSIDEELTGVLVTNVSRFSCAYGKLKSGDILQQIDGVTIHANGDVEVPELQNPIHYSYLILRKQYFETIVVTILRKTDPSAEFEKLDVPIRLHRQIGQGFLGVRFAEALKYHIHPSGSGALVFVSCNAGLMNTFRQQAKPSIPSFFGKLSEDDSTGVVVLYQTISSGDTDGFEKLGIQSGAACQSDRVKEINGQPINHLYDLIAALGDTTKVSIIKFANGQIIYTLPSTPRDIEELKIKQRITFFTNPTVKVRNEGPVLQEIKQLGERDDNRYHFLKRVEPKVVEGFGNEEPISMKIGMR